MKTLTAFITALLFAVCGTNGNCYAANPYQDTIPVIGNTYVTIPAGNASISERGFSGWDSPDAVLSLYFKTDKKGKLTLALKGIQESGKSKIRVSVAGKKFNVTINKEEMAIYPVGTVNLPQAGYVKVDFQGISKEGKFFPRLEEVLINGEAASGQINCVKGFSAYWGRRGPSVHMGYELPKEDVQYFYNEVTVPQGEDVMHSYFMAAGFGEGYFGMQVNSETERRILFSVWSPFNTDDPSSIPDDKKIIKLRQGEGVRIGEFGNEGSGGQSFLIYPWKAGNTYKFLAEVKPDGQNNTIYTAYFFAPEENKWRLIASFKRPATHTYYKHPHSFLENFNPQQGYITRMVYFDNQWARTTGGKWIELTKGTFTCDATARAGVRKDFRGGVKDGKFFLQNCGFFNESTPYLSKFERPAKGKAPVIDLEALEKL